MTDIKRLPTGKVNNADKKYENTIVGGINGSAKITGDTTGLNSINGSATLAMPYGTYDSPDLIKKIAEKLKVGNQVFDAELFSALRIFNEEN